MERVWSEYKTSNSKPKRIKAIRSCEAWLVDKCAPGHILFRGEEPEFTAIANKIWAIGAIEEKRRLSVGNRRHA